MKATENKETALSTLLAEVFDGHADGLRDWIRLSLGKEIHDELPGAAVGLSQLAVAAALAIQRHGRADTALFESLHQIRPRLTGRIEEVARLYRIESHAPASTRDTPAIKGNNTRAVHAPHGNVSMGSSLSNTQVVGAGQEAIATDDRTVPRSQAARYRRYAVLTIVLLIGAIGATLIQIAPVSEPNVVPVSEPSVAPVSEPNVVSVSEPSIAPDSEVETIEALAEKIHNLTIDYKGLKDTGAHRDQKAIKVRKEALMLANQLNRDFSKELGTLHRIYVKYFVAKASIMGAIAEEEDVVVRLNLASDAAESCQDALELIAETRHAISGRGIEWLHKYEIENSLKEYLAISLAIMVKHGVPGSERIFRDAVEELPTRDLIRDRLCSNRPFCEAASVVEMNDYDCASEKIKGAVRVQQ